MPKPLSNLVPLPRPLDKKIEEAQAKSDLPVVTVDDRENRIHADAVQEMKLAGVRIEVARMDFGDYAFFGAFNSRIGRQPHIGVEVSTVSDVVGKLNNDRLAFQLSNMLIRYDVSVLLITTPVQVSDDGYVMLPRMPKACTYDRLMDVLGAAQAHGVIVTYGAGSRDIPNRLLHLVRYWSREEGTHKYFRPRDAMREVTLPVGEAVDRRLQCLMTLPGIGEQRAIDALRVFGSLRNIFLAGESGYELIPGWGAITAKKVDAFLREPLETNTLPPTNAEK